MLLSMINKLKRKYLLYETVKVARRALYYLGHADAYSATSFSILLRSKRVEKRLQAAISNFGITADEAADSMRALSSAFREIEFPSHEL